MEVRRTLNAFSGSVKNNDAIIGLETSIKSFLLSTCDVFPLEDIEKFVTNQVNDELNFSSTVAKLIDLILNVVVDLFNLA